MTDSTLNKDISNQVSGIILAGGKNLRMGTNKAFLEIGGIRLIDRILHIYRQLFNEIIIVTNDPGAYTEFGDAAIVTDIYKGKGPLGGIFTGLFHSGNPCIFVSACDLPYLNTGFILHLSGLAKQQDVVVPETPDGLQPLCAVYSRNCLPVIKRQIERDKLKITGFFRDVRLLTVGPDEIRRFDPEGLLFQNVNTPSDLQSAENRKSNQTF